GGGRRPRRRALRARAGAARAGRPAGDRLGAAARRQPGGAAGEGGLARGIRRRRRAPAPARPGAGPPGLSRQHARLLPAATAGRLRLVGYGYDYFPGERGVRAADHAPLVLRWIFPSPDAGLYAIRWHLLDAGGHEAASGVEPLLGHFPLRPWERPSDVWDYHD